MGPKSISGDRSRGRASPAGQQPTEEAVWLPSSDGTRLGVFAWGPSDAPVVVLVHGLGLSMQSWHRAAEPLARNHRVVAYDLRGHGISDPAAGHDYTMPAHAADLRTVLDWALPSGRERAVVVGNSFGGGVILLYAHREGSQRMRGAVFAGSGGSAVTLPGFPIRHMPPRIEGWLRHAWLRLLRGTARAGRRLRPIEPLSNRLIRRYAFTADAPNELVAQVRDNFLTTQPVALARTTLASTSNNWMALAPHLQVPALVLHGECDPEVPPKQVQQLVKSLPQGELVTFAGAGHMLPLTHSAEVARQVAHWVQLSAAQHA